MPDPCGGQECRDDDVPPEGVSAVAGFFHFGVPAIRAGRGGDRDDRDQVPVRLGRVARRGDAAAGGGRGQWWATTGTGLAATTWLTRRNKNRP